MLSIIQYVAVTHTTPSPVTDLDKIESKKVSDKVIRSQLDHILASKEFSASKRNSDFLRYVIDQKLSNNTDQINGYNIGINVFGRPENFDPETDPIVRTQAVRLRRALKNYFYENETDIQIVISIPPGGYVPLFELKNNAPIKENTATVTADYPPKIAVLPFTDLSQIGDFLHLADGFSREMAVSLARFDHIAVISDFTSNRLHKLSGDISEIGEKLGAHFVLRGVFRQQDGRFRLTTELIDCRQGILVWGDRIDRHLSVENFFDVQDEVVSEVSSIIADNYGIIPRLLLNAPTNQRPNNLGVYDAVLQFQAYNHNSAKPSLREKTRECLHRAIELDPNYALAWAYLSEVTTDDYVLMYEDYSPEKLAQAHTFADKAIKIEPRCQYAYWAKAYAFFADRKKDSFIEMAEQAVSINPNGAFICGLVGWAMALSGECDRGHKLMGKAMKLNPYHPDWFHIVPCLDAINAEDFRTAHEHAIKFNSPEMPWDGLLRSATLNLIGKHKESAIAFSDVIALKPELSNSTVLNKFLRRLIWDENTISIILKAIQKS